MMQFGPLDAVVVAIFCGGLMWLGFSAKLLDSSILQFLAAGRTLSLPAFVAALVSTWYGGVLGIGESVSYFGIGTWALLGLPYYIFALLYAQFYAGRIREADQISIPERLATSYGKGPAAASAGLVFLLGVPAAHVLMLGVLVQAVTGWALPVCCGLAVVIAAAFLWRGGLIADVRIAFLAFIGMYVGFAVMAVWCLIQHPLPTVLPALADKGLLKWEGGQGWTGLLSFLILGAWTLIDPGFHQRAASTASPEISRRGILISVACWMVFDLLSITTGLYAVALGTRELANPLLIFPSFADEILPPGLKGLFFCGLLGAILSALVGYALVSGAAFGRDLVVRLRGQGDESQWAKVGVVAACAAALTLALSIQSVVALWYSWGGCVIGALLIPVSASYGVLRLSPRPAWVHTLAMGLAFCVSFGLLIYGQATQNPSLNFTFGGDWFGYNPGGSFAVGTLLPGLSVSALTLALGRFAARKTG